MWLYILELFLQGLDRPGKPGKRGFFWKKSEKVRGKSFVGKVREKSENVFYPFVICFHSWWIISKLLKKNIYHGVTNFFFQIINKEIVIITSKETYFKTVGFIMKNFRNGLWKEKKILKQNVDGARKPLSYQTWVSRHRGVMLLARSI